MSSSAITKSALCDSLKKLCEQKPFDKISISDITGECGLNRQSFYYHFQDMMDVIEWSLKQHEEVLLQQSLKASSMWDALRILVSSIEDRPEIINKLMSSQKREQTQKLLLSTARSYLREMISHQQLCSHLKHSDIETSLTFYSCALVGVLIENSTKRNLDLDILTDQLYRLVRGEMFS